MRGEERRSPEAVVREIRRKTRRKFSPEERIRIVLEGLKGEESIASICRREGITSSLYYRWSKAFLEAGVQRRQAAHALGYRPSAPEAWSWPAMKAKNGALQMTPVLEKLYT
jgi:hypothetical protein